MTSALLRLFAAASLFCANAARADDPPMQAPQQGAIESSVLHAHRPFEVSLPREAASDPKRRFDTLYVLDGEWNTPVVLDVVRFAQQVGMMPPVIVVSVPNLSDAHGNSRDHDLTPTVNAEQASSGGAADFLAFLKTELVPYVDAHYPTSSTRLIHGHSYGGLFLGYVLAHEPALFDGYLMLDPALRWDDRVVNRELEQALPTLPSRGRSVYIAGRAGSAFTGMGIAQVEPVFAQKANADLAWKIVAYPGETHDSLKLKATYDALRFMYAGFSNSMLGIVPDAGIVLRGQPVTLRVDTDAARDSVHVTTDGSEPTRASPVAPPELRVDDPTRVRIRVVGARAAYDRELPLAFHVGEALKPARSAGTDDTSWHLAWYDLERWPALTSARAYGHVDDAQHLPFSKSGRAKFAARITRTLTIPADGYYVVALGTHDRARVSLGGMQVLDHDGDKRRRSTYLVPLRAGQYPLRIDVTHAEGHDGLGFALFRCNDGKPDWDHPLYRGEAN